MWRSFASPLGAISSQVPQGGLYSTSYKWDRFSRNSEFPSCSELSGGHTHVHSQEVQHAGDTRKQPNEALRSELCFERKQNYYIICTYQRAIPLRWAKSLAHSLTSAHVEGAATRLLESGFSAFCRHVVNSFCSNQRAPARRPQFSNVSNPRSIQEGASRG